VGLVSGPVRFVLGSGGHIAGIVSPPGPKAWHMVSDDEGAPPATAADWRQSAERKAGTWWEDWTNWAAELSGPMRKPPRTGIEKVVTAKPALIAALTEAVRYCNGVYDAMTDLKGSTETTGPKISSCATVISWLTPARTVGG